MFATMNERMTNQENMLASIHERLEQDRQRVNLNVRAPKRGAPHQPQITRSLAGVGRPHPVAKFLDSKERDDPSSYRRLFVVPGHEGCEGPDRVRLRPDMDSALSAEKNQGWVTSAIIETRFFSVLPKKNEAR